jgi:MYXO-CTERM domain-containing protein
VGGGSSNGGTPQKQGGCGCGVSDAPTGGAPGAALLLLFALRRRSRGSRPERVPGA